ncbi:hypothetical protein OF83DRAFT_934036 [Amylostereum chailletii]|nr:hypothetical protein OF83DRAFT_934036 [Amylostereum chailletii]
MTPHDISLPYASFVGGWVAGSIYGFNLGLFLICARMLYKNAPGTRRWLLLAVATTHIISTSGHIISTFVLLIRGFISDATTPNGTLLYFINQAAPEHVAQEVFFTMNVIISDAMLVWRCHVVWNHSYWIGIPLGLTVVGSTVAGFACVGWVANLTATESLFVTIRWTTASYSISLGTQVIATTLIAWKIWSTVASQSKSARRNQVTIVWMIVESGAVLACTSATVLTLFLLNLNAGAAVAPIFAQLSFTVPTSIIIRVGMKRSHPQNPLPLHWRGGRIGMDPSNETSRHMMTTTRTTQTTIRLDDIGTSEERTYVGYDACAKETGHTSTPLTCDHSPTLCDTA